MATEIQRETVPVFLCYRQDDGSETAEWLYSRLHGRRVGGEVGGATLDVYFDQAAAAVGDDWSRIHLPYLERARALIFVCTPAVYLRRQGIDWVHMELDWWLDNRLVENCPMAPIVVDSADGDQDYLPETIRAKQPSLERIVVQPEKWPPAEAPEHETRVLQQIERSIRESETRFVYQEIEKEKARNAELQVLKSDLSTTNQRLQRRSSELSAVHEQLKESNAQLARVNEALSLDSVQLQNSNQELRIARGFLRLALAAVVALAVASHVLREQAQQTSVDKLKEGIERKTPAQEIAESFPKFGVLRNTTPDGLSAPLSKNAPWTPSDAAKALGSPLR
jgi:hypothetical protein